MTKLEKLPFCENFFFEIDVIRDFQGFPEISQIFLDIVL